MGLIKSLVKLGVGTAVINRSIKKAVAEAKKTSYDRPLGKNICLSRILVVSQKKSKKILDFVIEEQINQGWQLVEKSKNSAKFVIGTGLSSIPKQELLVNLNQIEDKLKISFSNKLKEWGLQFNGHDKLAFESQCVQTIQNIEKLFSKGIIKSQNNSYCSSCGKAVDSDSNFCGHCGSKIA